MIDSNPLVLLSQKDINLADLIKSIGNYNIEIHQDPFESLIKSIIYQQLAGKAANAIYQQFLLHYNKKIPTPAQLLSTPELILRTQIGLSFKKIEYLKDLSIKITTGQLDLSYLDNLSDEEIIKELVKVNGIGRWTAEMFLIFCLKREDIMPLGDLGVKKAIQKLYNLPELPTNEYIIKVSSQWKPYRSIATWYLWKSLASFDSIRRT